MDIAVLVWRCLESFCETVNLESNDQDINDQVHDESGRFRIWASNVSAHTTGRGSLQHRLRDSPELLSAVVKYLEDLLSTIEDMKLASFDDDRTLSSHLQTSQTDDARIDTDDDNADDEEDNNLFGHVVFSPSADGALEEAREIISCLFRLSMALRNPAPSDEIRYASTAITRLNETRDVHHVRSRFPRISPVLSERLGKAICRRRRYFNYREEHRQDLATEFNRIDEAPNAFTTYWPSAYQKLSLETFNSETEFLSPVTSRAPTETGDSLLQVPERPKTATDDTLFECPLCYHMITANNETSWHEHVYEDLRPYICLHEDCTASARQYACQRDWQSHMESHNRHWLCPYDCPLSVTSSEAFERHLQEQHLVHEPMLTTLSKSCVSHPVQATPLACTFCERPISTSTLWFEHVGHHLEQLALFALPSRLPSSNPDNIRDVASSMGERTPHNSNAIIADDASSLLSERGIIQNNFEDVEHLAVNNLSPSWKQFIQPEVDNDTSLRVPFEPTPSLQDQGTYDASNLSLQGPLHVLPNQCQPVSPAPEAIQRRYRCPECSRTFSRHDSVQRHMLTHPREEPYVCQTCEARFRHLEDLKRHTKTHTGELSHTCNTCGRRFASADALARHTDPVCAGRRANTKDNFVDNKGIHGIESPEEDLDTYGAIEDLDSGDLMSSGRKIKFPRIDDL